MDGCNVHWLLHTDQSEDRGKKIDISGGNELDWDSVLVQKKSLVEYTLSFYCEVLQFVLN